VREEDFQRLLRELEEMTDDEFVQLLERAGLVVESLPDNADADEVVMDSVLQQSYCVGIRPTRTWTVPGMEVVLSPESREVYPMGLWKPATWVYSDTMLISKASRYSWLIGKEFHARTVFRGDEAVAEVA